MNRAVANIFGAGVLLVGVAYAWMLTGDFEQDAAKNYPYAVLAFTGVVATLWLFRSIARLRAGRGTGSGEPALGTIGGYAALAGTLLYGGLVVYFGYVVPSVIYLAVAAYFLGGRRWGLIGAIAVLFPLALYTFLVYGFDRPLPF
ncbi:MAG: tripartite tricarboxylate transporter TctB family protein [Alphaproteobacteria bacterium]